MYKLLYSLIAIAIASLLYFLYSQQEVEEANSGKLAFSMHVDAFYNALLEARDKSLSVELGHYSWAVIKDGQTLRQIGWQHGARLGTNVPGKRLFFDDAGACHGGNGVVCGGSEITIASDVNRTYTITFDSTGKPIIEYDDF